MDNEKRNPAYETLIDIAARHGQIKIPAREGQDPPMKRVKIGIDQILRDSGIDPRRAAVESSGFDDDGNLVLGVTDD